MPSYNYGGQALIEGVMMRGRDAIAVALRHPDGGIVFATERLDSGFHGTRWSKWPLIRGLVVLYETLVVGTRWLVRSANVQAEEEGVELRGCERTRKIIPAVKKAGEADWHEEYLDLILSVKVVKDIDEAISHIEKYGSMHTESIITENYTNSKKFVNGVNSSTVMVNASTRFSDGYELGLGAEIGISTSKLHAFGPMGALELTTTKFVVFGEGQIRE